MTHCNPRDRRPSLPLFVPALLAIALLGFGCGADDSTEPIGAAQGKPAITNRIDIPPAVRQSLGITFARIEERSIGSTRRLAGLVEPTFEGLSPYHTSTPGIITVHVKPFDTVKAGQLLVSVSSSQLLDHRHQLHLAGDAVGLARDEARVAAAVVKEVGSELAHTQERIGRLSAAGTSKAELSAKAAQLDRRLSTARAQRSARQNALMRSQHRFEAELASFAARIGMSVDELRSPDASSAEHGDKVPRWEKLQVLEIRARVAGAVSSLPVRTGTWVAEGERVAEVVAPDAVWVVARALASDIGMLQTGQLVNVVPSVSASVQGPEPVRGVLSVGVGQSGAVGTTKVHILLEGSAPWLRPGATVFADVVVGGTLEPEAAVPVAALIRDGLHSVFFRRDPADADKVIRVVADLGPQDDQWAAVYSGVAPGDEVVVDGAYELKLASTSKPDVVGHFHADGTFHEGKE